MPTTPPELTLDQIMSHFATEEAARAYLEAVRWPEGPICPHCGNGDAARIYAIAANPVKKIRAGLRECKECGGQFTVTIGTIFEDSKIPLRKWLVAWYMLCSSKKGISALQMQRMLDIGSYRSAWFMMHRIRYALRDPAFSDKLDGGGTVEADETYVGGKVRGMGRGYRGNKTAVVSVVERGGRVRSRAAGTVNSKTLSDALAAHVDLGAHLTTDDFPAYRKSGRKFASHSVVNHSAGEYARGRAHTNTVEGYFSLFKRGIIGTQYMNQYLAEFDFRYSHREVSDGARMKTGLGKTEGKRLMLRRPAGQA